MGQKTRFQVIAAGAIALAGVMTSSGSAANAGPSCNTASGKQVFALCTACHSLEAGKNMAGPTLHGIVGRKSADADGFRYSRALSNLGIVWSTKNLDAFLASPQTFAKGTAMAFGGVRDAKKRADLVCYLKSAG